MKKILQTITVAMAFSPLVALAQARTYGNGGYFTDSFGSGAGGGPGLGQLQSLVDRFANLAVGMLIIISVLFIIYAAYIYLLGGTGATDTKKAKDILIYAVVAIALALLARVLVNVAVSIFDVGGY